MDGRTNLFEVNEEKRKQVSSTIKEVYDALKERGYNPINQLVGYMISGDPGYISGYKDCRNKILEFDRSEMATIVMEDYIQNIK